ncbi:MAG: DUF3149 domain-containing protein [Paludibacterium sp.]|nr:DUF3149 domain-containing protein [Paludibacterium sp.]MBV8049482.1 DUF3149 domain-containing protein [Paludibacterium sp.]MBV8646258.1 DUF3149 domain-containing protein [Paludibacterium sp.]
MPLIQQLLSDDVGVFSLITIVVATLVVGVCATLFIRKSKDPDPK